MNSQRMSSMSLSGRRRSKGGIGQGSDLEKQIGFEKIRVQLDDCSSR